MVVNTFVVSHIGRWLHLEGNLNLRSIGPGVVQRQIYPGTFILVVANRPDDVVCWDDLQRGQVIDDYGDNVTRHTPYQSKPSSRLTKPERPRRRSFRNVLPIPVDDRGSDANIRNNATIV